MATIKGRARPFVVAVNAVVSVVAISVSVSAVYDQVDQVVPAHQVDDIDEAHELHPAHRVLCSMERTAYLRTAPLTTLSQPSTTLTTPLTTPHHNPIHNPWRAVLSIEHSTRILGMMWPPR